jgi:heme exporter protein D
MEGAHANFIFAAYVSATIIVVCLMIWVIADYRAQMRALASLEAQGITRRSARAGAGAEDVG